MTSGTPPSTLDERYAVVRWLRNWARNAIREIRPADAREVEDTMLAAHMADDFANAIEQGEHWK